MIDSPLTTLTQRKESSYSLKNVRRLFQGLKDRLISSTLLTLGTENFVVYCDASRIGLGGGLMQNREVISYASRKLNIHENNYPTHDVELVVIILP